MRPGSRDAFGFASDELERIVRGSSGSTGSGSTGDTGGSGDTRVTGAPGVDGGPGGLESSAGGSGGSGDTRVTGAPGVDGGPGGLESSVGGGTSGGGTSGSTESTGSAGSSGGASGEHLAQLGDELYAAANALASHIDLRRHLVDPSVPGRARASLVEAVFGPKVGQQTTSLLSTLASHRVSTSTDFVEAVEDLGRDASLASAEADGTLSEVEDELFRFGRTLEREPRLRSLLADSRTAPDKRVELLDSVLQDRVEKVTRRLLEQLVRHPYTRSLDRGAEAMAEAAATRRDRSIARVTSPVTLGDEQEQRLADSLSSIYGRRISVHVDVEPEILGGLVIRIGGEVIDGSISGRLRAAENALPG